MFIQVLRIVFHLVRKKINYICVNKCIDGRIECWSHRLCSFFCIISQVYHVSITFFGLKARSNPSLVWWDSIIAFESWCVELNSNLIYCNVFFIVCACVCTASKFKSSSFPCSLWYIVFILVTFGSNF